MFLFVSATLAIAEGESAATSSVAAPAGVAASEVTSDAGGAPDASRASAPVGKYGTSALSPLPHGLSGTAAANVPQEELLRLLRQKGATPQPSMELPKPYSLGKEGTPASLDPSECEVPGKTEAEEKSTLEQSMSADDDVVKIQPQLFRIGELTQFGYNFFKKSSAFAPVLDVPVGASYIIGPGDILVLTASGSLDGTFPLEVNRSGEVILPKVGAVRVWGVPFGKVPELLKASLSQVFRSVQVDVSMGKLRLMKVYLVGEVKSPGDYNISALSTVINAVAAAGGPTKSGSLRTIQVKRDGKVVETVDLYEFFLKGDKSSDIRLQAGDTVYVPLIGKVAGIGGNVKRPGIYELKSEKSLKDLLELAGDFKPSGYLERLQISRVEAHDKKIVVDFKLDSKLSDIELAERTAGIVIQDQDIVKIFPIALGVRNSVTLSGHVQRPGSYALKPGMRLNDLIAMGTPLSEHYLRIVEVTRNVPPDSHPEKMYLNLAQVKLGSTEDNILLKESDIVRIFSRWEMEEQPKVRISGDVRRPGEYRLLEKMTLRDLILEAGNIKKSAYLANIEIVRLRVTGSDVTSYPISVALEDVLKGTSGANVLLQDQDEVLIRRLPEWMDETNRYVTLRGEVRFPGTYPIFKGEKLSSVLERAGGYTDKAYLKGAKFTRKSVREAQQERMTEVITRAEQDLARRQLDVVAIATSKEELEATRATMSALKASLDKLKIAKATGRLSLRLAAIDKLKSSPYDLGLQGGDELLIPQSTNSVMVFGEVYNPTTIVHIPGEDLEYFLKLAGGTTGNANESEMYVIRADGTVESRREAPGFLFYSSFLDMTLDPGDTVVVPQELIKVAWIRELKDIAFIIGQTALAAGVLVAAGL
jgi:protein involved in polysaccharide export with SLBB domain